MRNYIERFIRKHGRHAFTQRLLEGTLSVEVALEAGAGRDRLDLFEVVVSLELDMDQVHHVRTIDTEGTPVGQKRHHAVEAEHELIAGSRRTVEAERNLTGTVDVTKLVGAGGSPPWACPSPGPAPLPIPAAMTSSQTPSAPRGTNTSRPTSISLERRCGPRSVRGGPFPNPGRRVPAPRRRDPPSPSKWPRLTEPGDPPGAFRETPRVLPDSKRIGYSSAELANDPDGSRREAGERIEGTLHYILSEPEWARA